MDAMMLASGHAELWLEAHAKAWDLAPLKLILEEAGARFCNFDGGNSIYGGNGMAFVPGLAGAVKELAAMTCHRTETVTRCGGGQQSGRQT